MREKERSIIERSKVMRMMCSLVRRKQKLMITSLSLADKRLAKDGESGDPAKARDASLLINFPFLVVMLSTRRHKRLEQSN